MSDRPKCLHCKDRLAAYGKRGLCTGCYNLKSVRARYPKVRRKCDEGPSEAELEAIIAEQRKKLPKWWELDVRRLSPFRGGFTPRFTAPVRATERRAT